MLLPFVQLYQIICYVHYDNLSIPDELSGICWCDGGQTRLNGICDKANQSRDTANKIVTMKHCRGQIYVEQAYDAYLAFRFLKQISKHVIKSNLTSFELIETLTKSFSK